MQLSIISKSALSYGSLSYNISMPHSEMRMFGFLLESIDGLGYHSVGTHPDEMHILIPKDLVTEFEMFLGTLDPDYKTISP